MSKYAQGESSVKEVKNVEFLASLSVGKVKKNTEKKKTKKKSESK